MTAVLTTLPVVVIYPCSRCNCRCTMCDIWRRTDTAEITAETYERYLADFERLRVRWVVFSGGEPLMHPHLDRLCSMTRQRGIRTTILTTGLLLRRHAGWIVDAVDDVIVSFDGPPAVHDCIRGTPGAFEALRSGIQSLHRLRPDLPVSARCTVQRLNHDSLVCTGIAARELGLRSISYLAADVSLQAFDHGRHGEQRPEEIALEPQQLPVLDAEIQMLISTFAGSGLVQDGPEKLRRIAAHFRAHLGLAEPVAPKCTAPWVSTVIETDGTVRPCFFHPSIGRIRASGLLPVLNGPEAQAFRSGLRVDANEICRRCVCSLNLKH